MAVTKEHGRRNGRHSKLEVPLFAELSVQNITHTYAVIFTGNDALILNAE
jgi:hypothetical protein